MITLVVFIVSLVLISLMFFMKNLEIRYGRKIFLENIFLKCDEYILLALLKIKYWVSHINLKNTKLLFLWIMVSIRKSVIALKRRFDHKQSHFFAKREHDFSKSKASVSFFLKHVSDYKRSLRETHE